SLAPISAESHSSVMPHDRVTRCDHADPSIARRINSPLAPRHPPRAPSRSMPLLEIRDLRTYFHTDAGVARAGDGVSLTVDRGETVGIVGESGSGKSVTGLSVLRLIRPPGRIEPGSAIAFDGRDLLALGEAEMREVRGARIAMVFQEPMTALNPV